MHRLRIYDEYNKYEERVMRDGYSIEDLLSVTEEKSQEYRDLIAAGDDDLPYDKTPGFTVAEVPAPAPKPSAQAIKYMSTATWMQHRRKSRRYTLETVSRRTRISLSYLHDLESGAKDNPSFRVRHALAGFYQVPWPARSH